MTFEDWWTKEFSNVNIHFYENSSDALTKEWFNIVKRAFEDGKAATHSEDGRDSVQVVAFLMKPDFYEPYVSLHRDSQTSALCEPLMTVAQHERIVAAKDAEIARLNGKVIGLEDCAASNLDYRTLYRELREQVAAQPARQVGGYAKRWALSLYNDCGGYSPKMVDPATLPNPESRTLYVLESDYLAALTARQVGGDEPWRDEDLMLVPRALLGAVRYALKNKKDAPNLYDQLGEYCYTARAALAPAAVAVVMPERDDYHQIAFEIGGTEDGAYHFEADELDNFVARLNRSAIPVVMPERKQWDASAGTAENMKSAAWNSALDEVTRLNRSAIPVDELEALSRDAGRYRWLRTYAYGAMVDHEIGDLFSYNDAIIDEKVDELRALLGKEG